MSTSTFCQRLANALAARQLSRNALLHLAGPDFTYRKIQAYCAGESAPSLPFLHLLGELGFDLHFLITGKTNPAATTDVTHAVLAQLAQTLAAAQVALASLVPLPGQPRPSAQPVAPSTNEAAILAALRAAPTAQQELILAMLTGPQSPARKAASQ